MLKDYEMKTILKSGIANRVISELAKNGRKYNCEIKKQEIKIATSTDSSTPSFDQFLQTKEYVLGGTGHGKTFEILFKGAAVNEK